MKIVKVNPDILEEKVIEKAGEILEAGGVVAYPTETLYGLGANVFDVNAVERVFEIKGRDLQKPSSIAFRDLDQAKRFLEFTPKAEKLAKKFLPGPLTIILNSKVEFHEFLGGNKVSARIPDHAVAQALLNKIKFPITATSANLSGGKEPVEVKDVLEQIGDTVDLILDAGKCKYGKPSTVVDITINEIKVIREGIIKKEELI
ncbi:MAG: threonylcarbamoyl-AMP synthase [Candidatus Aenigmarchaeota archaeon]|nr:threonylcarbamoyl-AMP synthase [Candidatus Aenigmarchaeota archaeon]